MAALLSSPSVLRLGAFYGVTSISLGAFGAHGLQKRYPDLSMRSIKNWETASSYMLAHGVLLVALSMHPRFSRARWTTPLLATGVAMFSGSIYGLVLSSEGAGIRKVLGPMTPVGGLLMIAGWATMLF